MDVIAISALLISLLNTIGGILSHLHLKRIQIGSFCQSECSKTTPNTPTETTEI
jgi:hypothetical protein